MFITLAMSLAAGGCTAGIRHKPVAWRPVPGGDVATPEQIDTVRSANAAAEKAARGVRYYGRSLYLLANSDGRGGLEYRLMYLPDPTKRMSAEPYALLASLKAKMNFKNGMLADTSFESDATVVPKAVFEAVKTAASVIVAALEDAGPRAPVSGTLPAPSIYKVIVRGNEVQFIGGKGDKDIVVTLAPAKEAK